MVLEDLNNFHYLVKGVGVNVGKYKKLLFFLVGLVNLPMLTLHPIHSHIVLATATSA